jgi:VanZ family protein
LDKLRFFPLWLTIGFTMVALVVVTSLVHQRPHAINFAGGGKVEHFGAYAITTLWFCLIYTNSRVRWMIGLALIALGVCLECLQLLTEYRTFEYTDMMANAAGVFCVLLLAQTSLSRRLAALGKRIALPDPKVSSSVTEEYTRLRQSIVAATPELKTRVLLFTSSTEGGGAATVLAAFGLVLAGSGERALLVDTDLRDPTLHQLTETPAWLSCSPGKASFLPLCKEPRPKGFSW